jgi:hypothetical protein
MEATANAYQQTINRIKQLRIDGIEMLDKKRTDNAILQKLGEKGEFKPGQLTLLLAAAKEDMPLRKKMYKRVISSLILICFALLLLFPFHKASIGYYLIVLGILGAGFLHARFAIVLQKQLVRSSDDLVQEVLQWREP